MRKNSRFLTLKWQIWERTLSLQCLRRLSCIQSFKPWGLNALIICWIASWCTTSPQDINCAVVLHTQAVTSSKSVCFLLNSSSRQRLFEAQTLCGDSELKSQGFLYCKVQLKSIIKLGHLRKRLFFCVIPGKFAIFLINLPLLCKTCWGVFHFFSWNFACSPDLPPTESNLHIIKRTRYKDSGLISS